MITTPTETAVPSVVTEAGEPPTDRPALDSSFLKGLGGVTLLALAVRLMNVYWWRPTTNTPGYHGYRNWGDAFYYHWQANALANGAWYVDPLRWYLDGKQRASAAHPPLYSTYLALWSSVGLDSVTAHRVASSLLGTASVVVIGLLARRLAGNRAGIIAAVVAALYPHMWINDGMVLSETIAIFMTALALTAAYAFWRSPSVRRALILGATCGVAALSRTELVLLFPLVVIPLALLVHGIDWRAKAKLALLGCLAGALALAPWVVFNLVRFKETTTMTTGTGSAISAASCDRVYYGRLIGYYENCFHGPWPSSKLDESQRDLYPKRTAQHYIEHHLSRLPIVVGARIGRLWDFFKPGQTTALDWWIEGRGRAPSWIGLFAYYLLVPFAIGGLVVLRRRRIPIIPLLAFVVTATFAAAITFGVTRYRAPAEVSIVIAAAIGADALWAWSRARRARRAVIAR
jgi:4-amino-4-deoxy-L-arabinose transferase-like glycosyltransferase